MRAGESTLQWLRSYYNAVDGLRFEELAGWIHEDCRIVYPSGYSEVGRETILARMRRALGSLAQISHRIVAAWEEEGGELIFELEVTYRRRDGKTITRPGAGVFVIEDGRVREQRLFVDDHGVWGRASQELG